MEKAGVVAGISPLEEAEEALVDVLALEQQEARLLTAEWVKEVIAAHDGAIVSLAKAMPRMMAGRIAPHDSEHAEAELTRWVEEEFLRTLYRSNPWNTPKT